MNKKLAALCLAFVAVVGLAGCAADEPQVASDSIIVDVRTPEEFAAGHLEGALNIDVSAATFDDEISQLSTNESYVLYCRSGNRAGAALSRMQELGFTDLINAGGLDQAASTTGLAIVTGP
jgi:rhodanese-related sulfurtransferase